MNMSDLFERLLILRMPNIGPVNYGKLLDRFGGDVRAAAASLGADDAHVASV